MKFTHPARGAAALAVSMVLLFGMTLIAFFANRTMIFEQRTSANQYRSTRAFELADAGIEWATARLNDSSTLAVNSCTPAAGSGFVSFRERFTGGTTAYPGCQVDPSTGVPGASDCACPSAGAAALGNAAWPRFRVRFNAVAGDPMAIEVISRGCTAGDPCDPSQVTGSSTDASAMVRVLLKIVPTMPGGGAGAGLVSGSTTVVTGAINIVNTDTRGNGITINTGSNVELASGNGVSVVTLPGTPPAASILDNDPSLLKLTTADGNGELFFTSFFGQNFSDFQTNPLTRVITAGASANAGNNWSTCDGNANGLDCGKAVSKLVEMGITQFWVQPNVTFAPSNMPSSSIIAGGTLGTEQKPVIVATPGQFGTSGNIVAYGTFYGATATAGDDIALTGPGNATIFGSLISRGEFSKTGNGNLTVAARPAQFNIPGPSGGRWAPVPGSWRDKETHY
jgi:Tfp pilus assembly protein PilX